MALRGSSDHARRYLLLLREVSRAVAPLGRRALVFLAAAVSDFYVPASSMAAHKIQSRAHNGLTLHLDNVPKVPALFAAGLR